MEKLVRPSTRSWVFDRFTIQETTYPPLYRMPPHADAQSKLSLLVAGSVEEWSLGVAHWSRPGSLVVKPATTVHGNCFGPFGARMVSVVPNAKFMKEKPVDPELGDDSYRWCHDHRDGSDLHVAIRQVVVRRTARSLTSVEARLTKWLNQNRDSRNFVRPPSWLTETGARLRDNSVSPCSVRRLASDVGVHGVYLARVFRRYYRCTISEFVRRRRVFHAAELLANSDLPLAQIAISAGFADQPHFCHQFRRETDTTPHAYRQAVRNCQVAFVQSLPRDRGYDVDVSSSATARTRKKHLCESAC